MVTPHQQKEEKKYLKFIFQVGKPSGVVTIGPHVPSSTVVMMVVSLLSLVTI